MKDLKKQLIRLGNTNPSLRKHLRPILDNLNGLQKFAGPKASHHRDGDKWYADTPFVSTVSSVYPKSTLKSMGFGEFYLVTPDGNLEFDRMRGKDFPDMKGRSHLLYDDADGQVVEKAIRLMEQAGKSQLK